MAKTIIDKDLHFRLKEAGLISKAQIEIAQQDRLQHPNLELEEILTLRGWLKPKTLNFFANQIIELIKNSQTITLKEFIESAALLEPQQINNLIKLEEKTGINFDTLLIKSQSINKATISFFQKYLTTNSQELANQKLSASTKANYQKNSAILSEKKSQVKQQQISLKKENFRLALRLTKADLISEQQVEIALLDLSHNPDFTLEKVIFLRGWLQEQTILFFAQELPKLLEQNEPKISLDKCLQNAGLIDNLQVDKILQYQQENDCDFSTSLQQLGYIKKSTLKFFLRYLANNEV